MERRRLLAAVLGFVGWGLGLVYAGKHRFLGASLTFFLFSAFFAAPLLGTGNWELGVGVVAAAYLMVSLALAREAYLAAGGKDG